MDSTSSGGTTDNLLWIDQDNKILKKSYVKELQKRQGI